MLEQMYNFYPKNKGQDRTRSPLHQFLRIMKITTFILIAVILHVSATSLAQKVTLVEKNAPLAEVFDKISTQTGYDFLFTSSDLKNAKPVTINIKNEELKDALQTIFAGQPLDFSIEDKSVVIKEKQSSLIDKFKATFAEVTVFGKVQDELGQPMLGVSVRLKGSQQGSTTDRNGAFSITLPNDNVILVFSFVGYESLELRAKDITNGAIFTLKATTQNLREVVVFKGYYSERQELSTGNVSRVTAKEIEQQPVGNVLGALQGRVPGLVITQNTGLPGGGFNVQIRGQNSIFNGNDPFYVVDGVPYSSKIPSQSTYQSTSSGLLNGILKGGNPLSYLEPDDIESIEVLKDADATSIYGSRAANGAILITTKKGKAGAMTVTANVTSGYSSPDRDIAFMNTQQYLQMRNEAFKNDGATPQSYHYDVNGTWDTTRYTNWTKELTQNTSHYTDANLSLSGGNTNTQYLFSGSYKNQGSPYQTLLPGDGIDRLGSVHLNLNTTSNDQKFKINLSASYGADKNTIQSENFSADRYLAPDAPALFNPDGSLNFAPKVPGQAGTFSNPLSLLNVTSRAITSNLVANAKLSYQLLSNLSISSNIGYTNTQIDQVQLLPSTAFDPGYHLTNVGSSNFANSNTHGWIVEPQVNYSVDFGKSKLTALIGGTFNSNTSNYQYISASDYASDALLSSPQAAGSKRINYNGTQYRYNAIFGRVNYNLEDEYIVNLTARRDGSSRFGPGKQFGNFGAVGAAWIFTKKKVVSDNLPWLSFGKLRGSYGTTGNDQITDYQYLDIYNLTRISYQNVVGLYPQNLFNNNLAWEVDKKLEGGIELGFLKDRINIQANYFRNRSGNQLASLNTSLVTGYSSIPANLPAKVQNSGIEFLLNTVNVKSGTFSWTSSFNLSAPKNKLLSVEPGPWYSSFINAGNRYAIGRSITSIPVYHLLGVNPTTGLYEFASASGASTYSPDYNSDRLKIIDTAPKFYGGFSNTFSYKGFSLDLFFQFAKQTGLNIFGTVTRMPGTANNNMPVMYLNRWQKAGDVATYQRYSQDYDSQAYTELGYAQTSDFAYSDASYIRLKNAVFSWQLPKNWVSRMHLKNARLQLQAQNFLTISNYKGLDPETQSADLPPLKTIVLGLQVSL